MTGVLGELMGRECGLMGGKGGSMHLTDVDKGVMGSYAIIGAHLPIAWAPRGRAQYRGTEGSRCAFSAMAPPTSVHSTKRSPWPRSGNFRSYLCAKTISTWNTRRSRRGDAGKKSGRRSRLGLRARQDSHRRQRCRCGLSHSAGRHCAGPCGRGSVADRGADLSPHGHSRADPGKYRPPGKSKRG